jgi:MerR family transcriptional regulator/heat shock protein HspR
MHPQTLRVYEARGLIEPRRSPKGTRLYSQEDVEKLRRIQEMTAELGLNLAGVERVLDLEREIGRMHARIEELELQALRSQVRLAEELEQLRRSYRAELTVPYRGGALVRAADVRAALEGFRAEGDIDALWVLNDNGLLRDGDFVQAAWRHEVDALGVPVVVGVPTLVSPDVHFGTFAVLPDLDALGVQAANILLDVAEGGWNASEHPIELPISTLTVVNMRQVRREFGLREGGQRGIDRALE